MKHLRTDWQGIQDVRQQVFAELDGLEAMIDDPGLDDEDVENSIKAIRQLACVATDEWGGMDDYEASSIRDDEPVFVIRAKDPLAREVVRFYAAKARVAGSDAAYCTRLEEWAQEMADYAVGLQQKGVWPPYHAPDAPELLPSPSGG